MGPLAVHAWQVQCGEVTPGLVLDLRQPDRFARGHLPGARNLPYERLQAEVEGLLDAAALDVDQVVLLVDPGGARAAEMATWLRQRGHRACFLAGGLAAWTGDLERGEG